MIQESSTKKITRNADERGSTTNTTDHDEHEVL